MGLLKKSRSIFDFFDSLTANYLMTIGSLLSVISLVAVSERNALLSEKRRRDRLGTDIVLGLMSIP